MAISRIVLGCRLGVRKLYVLILGIVTPVRCLEVCMGQMDYVGRYRVAARNFGLSTFLIRIRRNPAGKQND